MTLPRIAEGSAAFLQPAVLDQPLEGRTLLHEKVIGIAKTDARRCRDIGAAQRLLA
jgi:hypothetical protein